MRPLPLATAFMFLATTLTITPSVQAQANPLCDAAIESPACEAMDTIDALRQALIAALSPNGGGSPPGGGSNPDPCTLGQPGYPSCLFDAPGGGSPPGGGGTPDPCQTVTQVGCGPGGGGSCVILGQPQPCTGGNYDECDPTHLEAWGVPPWFANPNCGSGVVQPPCNSAQSCTGGVPPAPSCQNGFFGAFAAAIEDLLCSPITPCSLPGYSMLSTCGGSITFPPGGGGPSPGNPCATLGLTLPPCGPVPPLACGTLAQCIGQLLPCTSANPPAYCSITCALPGVPVVNPANPISPAPGGMYVNTVVVTASTCTGVTQTPGQPVFLPISPNCPAAETIEIPENPRLIDADGDGIPALYYDTSYYQLDANCNLQKQYTGTTMLPFPDPDDTKPNVLCGPAEGTTFTAPEGALIQDRDGDGWDNVYVQMAEYELDASCNLQKVGNYEVPLNVPDPDDANPNVPPSDPIGVCGGAPGPCPILSEDTVTLCGIEDADADRVAIAYVCKAKLVCYSNGSCRMEQQETEGGYGDPDDNDPCVPISDTRLNPQCRYDGRRFGDQLSQHDGNDFGNERGHRTWFGLFSETTSWLWLLLIIGLLLLYMGGRERQKNQDKRRRRR